MSGVLIGFAIIGFVILVGYVVERFGIAGADAGRALNRVAFFVATPALLFTVLAHADVRALFSSFLVTVLCSVAVGAALYVVVSRIFFRTPVPETTLGATGSTLVNASNIGLSVAVYVLGSAQYVAPVVLLQMLVLIPITLGILDLSTSGHVSFWSIVTQPLRNPMLIASVAGEVLFAVVTVAALPTAQNMYNFSARYNRGTVVARDTVLVTTVASVPALVVIAALLA